MLCIFSQMKFHKPRLQQRGSKGPKPGRRTSKLLGQNTRGKSVTLLVKYLFNNQLCVLNILLINQQTSQKSQTLQSSLAFRGQFPTRQG